MFGAPPAELSERLCGQDTNAAVASLVIEAPRAGGQFEWAPFSRDEGDENYPEMRKVFDGSSSLLRSYELVPGDLVLFRGRRSAHRVAPLGRDGGRRVVALLSYADEPDFYWRHLKPDKDGADPSYASPNGQV